MRQMKTVAAKRNRTCAIKLDNVLFDMEDGSASCGGRMWTQAKRAQEFCAGASDPKLRRHADNVLMRVRKYCPNLQLGRRRKRKRSR